MLAVATLLVSLGLDLRPASEKSNRRTSNIHVEQCLILLNKTWKSFKKNALDIHVNARRSAFFCNRTLLSFFLSARWMDAVKKHTHTALLCSYPALVAVTESESGQSLQPNNSRAAAVSSSESSHAQIEEQQSQTRSKTERKLLHAL